MLMQTEETTVATVMSMREPWGAKPMDNDSIYVLIQLPIS